MSQLSPHSSHPVSIGFTVSQASRHTAAWPRAACLVTSTNITTFSSQPPPTRLCQIRDGRRWLVVGHVWCMNVWCIDVLQFVIFRDRDVRQVRDQYLIISIYIFQHSSMFQGVPVCMFARCASYLHNEPHYNFKQIWSKCRVCEPDNLQFFGFLVAIT